MFDECKKYKRLLDSWHDGTISPRDLTNLEGHLTVCAACRDAVAADDALLNVLVDEPCAAAVQPEPFDLPILDSLNGQESTSRPLWQLTVLQAIAGTLAAAAVTALVLSPVLKSSNSSPAHTTVRIRPMVASPGFSLQRLLDAATPQAAFLWTRPRTGDSRVSPG